MSGSQTLVTVLVFIFIAIIMICVRYIICTCRDSKRQIISNKTPLAQPLPLCVTDPPPREGLCVTDFPPREELCATDPPVADFPPLYESPPSYEVACQN